MELVFDERRSDSPYIDGVWRTHSKRAGDFTSLAESRSELVVTRFRGRTSITVRGPETRASAADYPADAEFFGIILKLGTFMPHLPTRTIMDRHDLTLPEAGGRRFWLHGAAWEFPSFDNADTFADRLMREGVLVRDPLVEMVLSGIPYPLSIRAQQYRFVQATGLTQTTIQQIARARQAMTLLQQGVPILDTISELGYYDQPHLTRALKRFVGQTPAQIARAGAAV